MENNAVSKYTISFGVSLALASVSNALLVIAKEKSPAVQAGMQRFTGQHWVTHAVVIIILFVFFGWLLARANRGQGLTMTVNRLIKTIVAGVFTASLIILGFYLAAD